jgi:hypothetical protein
LYFFACLLVCIFINSSLSTHSHCRHSVQSRVTTAGIGVCHAQDYLCSGQDQAWIAGKVILGYVVRVTTECKWDWASIISLFYFIYLFYLFILLCIYLFIYLCLFMFSYLS